MMEEKKLSQCQDYVECKRMSRDLFDYFSQNKKAFLDRDEMTEIKYKIEMNLMNGSERFTNKIKKLFHQNKDAALKKLIGQYLFLKQFKGCKRKR